MKNLKRSASCPVVCLLLIGCLSFLTVGSALAADSTLTIRNETRWVITEFYVSETDDEDWGPDQFGDEVVGYGEEFILYDIPCDFWDIMFIDEDGDECILEEVDLCNDDAIWVIDKQELAACGY